LYNHGATWRSPDELEQKLIERLIARDERASNELVKLYERRVLAGLVHACSATAPRPKIRARSLRPGLQGHR
jgi:hypothetical protein